MFSTTSFAGTRNPRHPIDDKILSLRASLAARPGSLWDGPSISTYNFRRGRAKSRSKHAGMWFRTLSPVRTWSWGFQPRLQSHCAIRDSSRLIRVACVQLKRNRSCFPSRTRAFSASLIRSFFSMRDASAHAGFEQCTLSRFGWFRDIWYGDGAPHTRQGANASGGFTFLGSTLPLSGLGWFLRSAYAHLLVQYFRSFQVQVLHVSGLPYCRRQYVHCLVCFMFLLYYEVEVAGGLQ